MDGGLEPVLIGTFPVLESQRERWKSGELIDEWYRKYKHPEGSSLLFDEHDKANTELQKLNHFYEWLAAILLYHSLGYLSLIEQYEFPSHPRKQEVVRRLIPRDVLDLIRDHKPPKGWVQCPDLLVYAPDFSDWFFCEVKGGADHFNLKQEEYFDKLARQSKRPIRLIRFELKKDMP